MTTHDLAGFVAQANEAVQQEEQRLNAADAKLGDGDTGSMLRRVLAAMAKVDVAGAAGLSEAAMALAQAAMKETGSSLGTLVATAAMTFAKEAKAAGNRIEADDMGRVVSAMCDAVASRGRAATGDKTVIDSLDAIARALSAGPATLAGAERAARDALDAFRALPCKVGRARMFPEKSTGADDPGMLAIALLLAQGPRAEA
ncbi:DAK2 domain-containing protein [Aurantimonas sp. VKM B-3413]|uniref:DAK2 domain-containing protein n=1 Tax=Aurantimonas sp. VKM B-3413 TaxID=2779401 RepID=UPI001E2D5A2A|nr:DAK2 domain-containing protein [Aurantimonas sp. VKM B-3413]MCB8838059.1 dihydroxyacetone kinase subunit L [Aurantimonas sp. VKM B-3413]